MPPPMKQPRRAPTGRPGSRPGGPRQRSRPRTTPAAAAAPTAAQGRSRFTGRAMVLVLVLSVLTISYASSLKAYFQQRSQIEQLRTEIATNQSSIHRLQDEKAQWSDPAYVREQARARFGYLMPGQTSYVVIGADGKPLAAQSTLSDPRTSTSSTPTAWWTTEWRSVQLAGDPPTDQPKKKPLKYLGGHHQ
ncbi:septum formation initiator family protein [Nocardioides sp.]|uniref:FtsB family cell division protein n=1 Tax=Nocardioides sp. TaxID=35761 RepID=UPI002F3F37F0